MNNYTPDRNASLLSSGSKSLNFIAKIFTTLFFFSFFFSFSGFAQNPPSCSLAGPLSAKAKGKEILVEVKVANSSRSPRMDYSLPNNTSHAAIALKGPVKYNPNTNSATQQISILPGNVAGAFYLQLKVTTPNGTCECSKSVSVSQ